MKTARLLNLLCLAVVTLNACSLPPTPALSTLTQQPAIIQPPDPTATTTRAAAETATSVPIPSVTPGVVSTKSPTATLPAVLAELTFDSPLPDLAGFPIIDRYPVQASWPMETMSKLPSYNPDSIENWQVDLRHKDLTSLDLIDSIDDLLHADFDSRTIWPEADRLPIGFDWEEIMEVGKNPGLEVRQLHDQGVTGRGIGIAMIDQTLLLNHPEYAERIQLYEEMDDITRGWREAQMHGPAVASIAVGKTIGVAPEADLYYIASGMCGSRDVSSFDFSCRAQALRRIIEINELLPEDRKIRVVSMAFGWTSDSKGGDEMMAAAQAAREAGMLVICSSVDLVHGFKFHGLGRSPLADPDDFKSYEPGLWWGNGFFAGQRFSDRLLVPMDARTTASPTGINDYVFYRIGGWSWSIPYIAGMYALAAQVKPDITPDEFWSLAMETGRTIQLEHDGERIPFGPILDPAALVAALKK